MAKKKLAERTRFQMVYERILGSAALFLAFFHACITFVRHFFTPENMMFSSDSFVMALKADRWLAAILIMACTVYLLISKKRFPQTWHRIRSAYRRLFSKEWILLFCMLIWYIICCRVYSKVYSQYFKTYDWFLFDFAVCVFLLFPMASVAGYRKIQKYMDILLHAVMVLSTGFILWALWNLFHLNIVRLPNGLQLGMANDYTFYPGVNQNIGAAIGTTMVMISFYMIAAHRWQIKLVYAIAMVPHFLATMLTGSRANFVAMLIAFVLFAWMLAWNNTKKQGIARRILISAAAAAAAGAAVAYLRTGVFQLFESITHLSTYLTASPEGSADLDVYKAAESLLHDSGRLPIWRASLKMMTASARAFFFGYPIGNIPQAIKDTIAEIYGSGSLKAHAHNMILQAGLVAGVPGMLMFIAFLVMMAHRCVRVCTGKAKGNLPGAFILPVILLAVIAVNMFEPFLLFYCSIMACLFFLFCGWIVAIDRGDQDSASKDRNIQDERAATMHIKRAVAMNTKRKMGSWTRVVLLFAGVVIIRYILALTTSTYPTAYIDEFLYADLGRSIATEGSLLFFGQPANYSYILYPLVISPVYFFFQEGANYYRIIQLWNIILMSASVFPIYALSRKMIRDERKALLIAALCMLLPEFMVGQRIFSEAILYPLFFGTVYFIYGYLDDKNPRHLLAIGALGGLMYCTKPGSMVAAILFLIVALAGSIAKKEKKNTLFAAESVLVFCAVIAFFWCLAKYAFGYNGHTFSIYNSQIAYKWDWNLDVFVKSVLTYPYYFILSCGIVGFAYPFMNWKYWNDTNKKFWLFILVSLFVMMIGTAWVINRSESNENLLHIRYIAMYIPLMILFCFLPVERIAADRKIEIRSKASLQLGILLAFVVISTLVWGCKTGARTIQDYVLVSLSILINQVFPLSSQTVGNIIIIILSLGVFFIFIKCCGKKTLQKLCIAALLLFMLVNGVCGYEITSQDANKVFAEDGWNALRLTDGHEFIYLKTIERQLDSGINVNTKRNPDMVLMNDFVNHLTENQGCYVPFVPTSLRGYRSKLLTADTDTLVLDDASYPLMKINASAATEQITPNKKFSVVHFTPGERVIDSAVGNIFNRALKIGSPGVLLIFDQTLLQQPLTIRFHILCDKPQTMKVFCTHEMQTIELREGFEWYEVTFSKPEDAFNFVVQHDGVKLFGYELSS